MQHTGFLQTRYEWAAGAGFRPVDPQGHMATHAQSLCKQFNQPRDTVEEYCSFWNEHGVDMVRTYPSAQITIGISYLVAKT